MNEIRRYVPEIRRLYEENDFPSDRLFKDQPALTGLTKELNTRTGNAFDAKTLADELERIRKDKAHTGGLPKLGRNFRGPKFRG